MDNGGPAFPVAEDHRIADDFAWTASMTLRDYFAAKAMPKLLDGALNDKDSWHEIATNPKKAFSTIANASYHMAEAMLEERKKEKP